MSGRDTGSAIASRASQGSSLSDSRPDIYDAQTASEEADPAGLSVMKVDTTAAVEDVVQAVIDQMKVLDDETAVRLHDNS